MHVKKKGNKVMHFIDGKRAAIITQGNNVSEDQSEVEKISTNRYCK
jgi:hypothetical protein